jgi:hypothetical protein
MPIQWQINKNQAVCVIQSQPESFHIAKAINDPAIYAWQSPDGVNALQIGISIIFIALSGFLSMVWGNKFLAALGKLLNSSDGL